MRARSLPFVLLLAACNGGLEPTNPACPPGLIGICGTVTFRGRVPDSTAAVYVVAYATFPQSTSDFLNFKPFPPPALRLPGDTTTLYFAALPSGRYEWVVAAWVKQGVLTTESADSLIYEAGFYRDGGDTTSHGTGIVVVNGTRADSINIVVDFNNMHPISDYLPTP
ncbi:MAG TPA: hypothetical protein VLT79_01835 [Gemmatimonadales bacterium]|nr:hypothetical protein [Gemmatimonadales bacterium]